MMKEIDYPSGGERLKQHFSLRNKRLRGDLTVAKKANILLTSIGNSMVSRTRAVVVLVLRHW